MGRNSRKPDDSPADENKDLLDRNGEADEFVEDLVQAVGSGRSLDGARDDRQIRKALQRAGLRLDC